MRRLSKKKCPICKTPRPFPGYKYCSDKCCKKANALKRAEWLDSVPGRRAKYAKTHYEKNKSILLARSKDKQLKKRWGCGGEQSSETLEKIRKRMEAIEQERAYLQNLLVGDFHERHGMCGRD